MHILQRAYLSSATRNTENTPLGRSCSSCSSCNHSW